MKKQLRKVITFMLTTALATTVFTGCRKTTDESIDLSTPSTSIEYTSSSPEERGTVGGTLDGFKDKSKDMRYTNWYDSSSMHDRLTEQYDELKKTGKLDKKVGVINECIDVYEVEGKKYALSGATLVDVEDLDSVATLRVSKGYANEGQLVYMMPDISLSDSDLVETPNNYKEYTTEHKDLATFSDGLPYTVYINGFFTGDIYTYSSAATDFKENLMPISKWLDKFSIDKFTNENTYEVRSAIGTTSYTIEDTNEDEYKWKISFADGDFTANFFAM